MLQPAADFSPPVAAFTSLAGGRAQALGRLKSAPLIIIGKKIAEVGIWLKAI